MNEIEIGFKINASLYLTLIKDGTKIAIDMLDIKETVDLAGELNGAVSGLSGPIGSAILLTDESKPPILVAECKNEIDEALSMARSYKNEALNCIKNLSNG